MTILIYQKGGRTFIESTYGHAKPWPGKPFVASRKGLGARKRRAREARQARRREVEFQEYMAECRRSYASPLGQLIRVISPKNRPVF